MTTCHLHDTSVCHVVDRHVGDKFALKAERNVSFFEHIINCSIIYIVAIANFTGDLRFQVVGEI